MTKGGGQCPPYEAKRFPGHLPVVLVLLWLFGMTLDYVPPVMP